MMKISERPLRKGGGTLLVDKIGHRYEKKIYVCTERYKYTCKVFAYIDTADKNLFWSNMVMFLVIIFLVKNSYMFSLKKLHFWLKNCFICGRNMIIFVVEI